MDLPVRSKALGKRILVDCMLGAFAMFLLSPSPLRCGIIACLFVLVCVFLHRRDHVDSFDSSQVLLSAAILLFAGSQFYARWIPSSAVRQLAARVALRSGTFLVLAACGLGAFSFYGLNALLTAIFQTRPANAIKRWLADHKALGNACFLWLIFLLEFFQLQRSSLNPFIHILEIQFPCFLLNIGILLFLCLLLSLVFRGLKRGCSVLAVFITVLAVANYYVIQFHGSPLFPSEFSNTKTALNVIGQYSFRLSEKIVDIFAALLAQFYLIRQLFKEEKAKSRLSKDARRFVLLAVLGALLFVFLYSPIAVDNKMHFSWYETVREKGYLCRSAAGIQELLEPIQAPKGYDAERIQVPEGNRPAAGAAAQTPDIILIVNESFCDLSAVTEIETDWNYLAPYYGIQNAFFGRAYSPNIGGGTNNTEFELLTSCSMSLLPNPAPFNYIQFSPHNSIFLTYLKELGYSTNALHGCDGTNYSRHIAYPALGFDRVILGEGSFSEVEYNGNRPLLDSEDYKGLISLYEQDSAEHRFYYLLTFQNHGGYDMNDAALDTVHIKNDFGEDTDIVNEYLSSVALSAEAFRALTDYFSTVDRPVVICMVGDHAPPFVTQLPTGDGLSAEEKDLKMKCVPFVFWSNTSCHFPEAADASMTDLLPLLLSSADMPETLFYQTVLDLHDQFPVRTSNGLCMNADGAISRYNEDDPAYDALTNYYFMEYNLLSDGEDYLRELLEFP